VHPHDLVGYVVAQVAGAVTAVVCLRLVWGSTARGLHLGATQPGHGFTALDAAGLEAAMTAALILMIFLFTSHARSARWTPLGNWLLVATLVWQGAPYTGTSLNPVRSFGPALSAPHWSQLWVYFAGPVGGALLAAAVFAGFKQTDVLTAKLFHDSRYRSVLGTDLPSKAPAPSAASRNATTPSAASSP
jgi:aquaporin Z